MPRFRTDEKIVITKNIRRPQRNQTRRGLIDSDEVVEYLPRRLSASIFMMPFYAYSQSSSGLITDAHTFEPVTLPGFPLQPRQFQDGDIMLMEVETSAGQTVPTPADWELAPNMPVSNGDTKLTLFWKRLQNVESTHTVADSGEHQMDRIFIIRGCVETGNPFDVSATNTGTGTTITFPSVTSTTDKGFVFLATTFDRNAIASDLSSPTNPTLENIREELGFSDLFAGVGGGMGFFSAEMPVKGATGTTTVIQDTSVAWTAYTAVLKPCKQKKPYLLNASNFAGSRAKLNDIIFAMIETNNEAVTADDVAYTQVTGSPVINAGANPTRLTMFWKRATSSETFPTFSGPANHSRVWVVNIRGCIETGDPFEASYATNTGTGTSVSVGGITTTVNNCFVLTALASTRDATAQFTTFNTWANASLDNFIPHVDSTTSAGTGGGVALGAGYMAAAGAVNATSAIQSVSVEWAAWMGALKPAV